MRLGREGIADGMRRIEPEQPEEGVIAIGEAAGSVAPEDRIALRIHQAFVASLALVQARIDDSRVLERSLKPAGNGLQLLGLPGQGQLAFARGQKMVEQKGQAHSHQGTEAKGTDDGQPAPDQHVTERNSQHGAGHDAKDNRNDPRRRQKGRLRLEFSRMIVPLGTFRNA